jgi:hypothetical protein
MKSTEIYRNSREAYFGLKYYNYFSHIIHCCTITYRQQMYIYLLFILYVSR